MTFRNSFVCNSGFKHLSNLYNRIWAWEKLGLSAKSGMYPASVFIEVQRKTLVHIKANLANLSCMSHMRLHKKCYSEEKNTISPESVLLNQKKYFWIYYYSVKDERVSLIWGPLACLLLCPTEEKSDVSGPVRYIKMCSCFQCAMQRKSVCWRAMICLAHMEQGPDPLHPGHPPPPLYLRDHWKLILLVAFNKDGSGQCSGQLRTA